MRPRTDFLAPPRRSPCTDLRVVAGAALVAVASMACEGRDRDSNEAVASATAPAPEAPLAAPTSPPTPTEPGAPPRTAPAPETDDLARAAQLGHAFRDAALEHDRFDGWLEARAAYPFDLDGKVIAAEWSALRGAIATEVPDLDQQVAGQATCEATTPARLLDGGPWHFLDRLGTRPPAAELARDLRRMGVRPDHILINCFHDDDAGFTLVALPNDGDLAIVAFRN